MEGRTERHTEAPRHRVLEKLGDLGVSMCRVTYYGCARPIDSPDTMISTRRFCWRPAAVPLVATGRVSPNPTAATIGVVTPCWLKYCRTDWERRSDNRWLYSSEPVLSA